MTVPLGIWLDSQNRLDEIVQFDALTVAELTRIVDLQVESLHPMCRVLD